MLILPNAQNRDKITKKKRHTQIYLHFAAKN